MPTLRKDANPAALRALGRAVRFMRDEAGMTQQALADEADVTRGTIANIERGSQNTTFALLWTISMVCGWSVEELVAHAAGNHK